MEPGKIQPYYFAKWYKFWYRSDPFDIGMTTRAALQNLMKNIHED
jgi:hypothetical protein